MDFNESAEHIMLREAVADIAGKFGHEYFAECNRTGAKTDELWQALADQGFLSVHLPEADGGGGGGMTELAIVCEEVAAQGCPLLLILVTAAICAEVIAGSAPTRSAPSSCHRSSAARRWRSPSPSPTPARTPTTSPPSPVATATSSGSPAARPSSPASTRRSGSWSSRAPASTRNPGRAKLSLFVVDVDTPGLEMQPIAVEIAAPEKQYLVFFDNVEVPADRLIGEEHDGLRQVFYGLNPERITGAALCNGIARYSLDKASVYARDRVVWGVPIGMHQGVSHPLAQAKVEVELARLMTSKAAFLHDHATDRVAAGEAANMAKYAAAEAGLHALDPAIQTHGGNGMTSEYGIADMWGMMRLLRIAPVSREMILNFVAQHVLDLPKSY